MRGSLFMRRAHNDLLQLLVAVLRPGATAVLVAPPRSGSLQHFYQLALRCPDLDARLQERYDDMVWERRCAAIERPGGLFSVDLHYPWLLELTRRPGDP